MLEHFKFGRLDRDGRAPNFSYTTHTGADADWTPRSIAMQEIGAHWSITIRNYMREDLLLVNNLRSEPQRYASIYAYDELLLEDTNNFVIIELRHCENERAKDRTVKVKNRRRIEIRCPGHCLQTQSLYVEELGCYLTVESRLQATRELIAQDTRFPNSKEVAVPESTIKSDPVSTLRDFEPLLKNCMERSDKIQVRVGVRVDVDPSRVPEHVKSMRIAIMDRDFSPYHNNRMVYDPTLREDEFIVENLHFVSSEPLKSTWDRLQRADARAFFIDTQEHRTMGGLLCGLVIFADEDALHNYLFAHKSEEIYNELTERLIDKTGSHALKKKIQDLDTTIAKRDEQLGDLENALKFEKNQNKEYKRVLGIHEETIRRLKDNHEPSLAYEAVMAEIENDRETLRLDREKLEHERIELERKYRLSQTAHKAGALKSAAEILKSGWGILVIVGGVSTAAIKGWKTLKSSTA